MDNRNTQSSASVTWRDYRQERIFTLIMLVLVGASTWLSQFIPDDIFDNQITPISNVATVVVALYGAWITLRHIGGMRARKAWCVALVVWGLSDLFYLVSNIIAPQQVMNMGAVRLTTYELLLGNLLGWVMTLYPTETLRPGWLNWKVVLWQVIPMIAMVGLDYLAPSFNLRPVIALYPYVLLIITLTHIRAYRRWCEDNYSSMEHIDTQWIIRYCTMLAIIGINYVLICSMEFHTRAFTQQWFVIYMIAYSTEQILYRKDPWAGIKESAEEKEAPDPETLAEYAALREKLEAWMVQDKPYLNPDLKLVDLRAAFPTNRTYLSQLLNSVYGCTFYQFINRYRVEEAKRIMTEQPDLKMVDVASRAGFSSPSVFSNIFMREVGSSPSDWNKQHAQNAGGE